MKATDKERQSFSKLHEECTTVTETNYRDRRSFEDSTEQHGISKWL